jgi:hypothetical protein
VTTQGADLFDALAEGLASRVAEKVLSGIAEAVPAAAETWRLLTVDEVADVLGRSRRSVFSYIKARGLPVIHLDNGSVRVDPDDLRAWCRGRRIPAVEPSETACEPLADRMDRTIQRRKRTTTPMRNGGS